MRVRVFFLEVSAKPTSSSLPGIASPWCWNSFCRYCSCSPLLTPRKARSAPRMVRICVERETRKIKMYSAARKIKIASLESLMVGRMESLSSTAGYPSSYPILYRTIAKIKRGGRRRWNSGAVSFCGFSLCFKFDKTGSMCIKVKDFLYPLPSSLPPSHIMCHIMPNYYAPPEEGCKVRAQRDVEGLCCVFPFIYKGQLYYRCTSVDHHRLWCATVPNYDKDPKWKKCATKCEAGAQTEVEGVCCVFPFTYKGQSYDQCTTVNHDRLWCAIVPNYDKDPKWKNCI